MTIRTGWSKGPLGPKDLDKKDTNPKDAIGSKKVPLDTIPAVAIAEEALALLDGGCKYGLDNYRVAGVRASVYIGAIMRHLERYREGEDRDPDSPQGLVHHLGNIKACCSILLEAASAGILVDDRPPVTKKPGWMERYNERARSIIEFYGDKIVPPYTQEKDGNK